MIFINLFVFLVEFRLVIIKYVIINKMNYKINT